MNESVENLILEHLRQIRSELTDTRDEMRGMHAEMRSLKQHMAAFMTHETSQDADIAAVKLQLERIGKRLELVDE